ncbi:hypothetical protein ACTXG6_40375 [Pseudonocardia sp. Cha107L01]|uniref:hypothetical protein n=1 Tax=Pseudonocardia sp. Cha107L01 TaxID=3457576 RepID=UPI00403EDA36
MHEPNLSASDLLCKDFYRNLYDSIMSRAVRATNHQEKAMPNARIDALSSALAVITANRHGIELPPASRDAMPVTDAELLDAVAFLAGALADQLPTGGPATLRLVGLALSWVEAGGEVPGAGGSA